MNQVQKLTADLKKVEQTLANHDLAIIKLQSAKQSEVTMLGKAKDDEVITLEDLKATVKVLNSYKKQGIKQIQL